MSESLIHVWQEQIEKKCFIYFQWNSLQCVHQLISATSHLQPHIYVKIKKKEITGVVVSVFNLNDEYKAWECSSHIPLKFKTDMLMIIKFYQIEELKSNKRGDLVFQIRKSHVLQQGRMLKHIHFPFLLAYFTVFVRICISKCLASTKFRVNN